MRGARVGRRSICRRLRRGEVFLEGAPVVHRRRIHRAVWDRRPPHDPLPFWFWIVAIVLVPFATLMAAWLGAPRTGEAGKRPTLRVHSHQTRVNTPTDPESVVQRQLDAYNARDVEGLLATYAGDAQLFEHPSTLLATGSAEIRVRFTLRFKEPNLHATLVNRMVSGATVVDHERITRTFPEGPGTLEAVMIYEVRGGRIARSWAIAGQKTLHPATS